MFWHKEEKKKRESKELDLNWFEAWYKFDLLQKIHIMVTHRLKVLQFNDSSGRSVLCKTAEQLLEFLFNMETWKDIPWYEWKYQVSNIWNINSLSFNKTKVCKSLNKYTDKDWYLYVKLCKDWKVTHFRVSRLVLQAFIRNPEQKEQANHKNGIRNDNRLENLEWVTDTENKRHSFRELWRKEKMFRKYVLQYSLDWEFIKRWDSRTDARLATWVNNISKALSWEIKRAGNFIWKI